MSLREASRTFSSWYGVLPVSHRNILRMLSELYVSKSAQLFLQLFHQFHRRRVDAVLHRKMKTRPLEQVKRGKHSFEPACALRLYLAHSRTLRLQKLSR